MSNDLPPASGGTQDPYGNPANNPYGQPAYGAYGYGGAQQFGVQQFGAQRNGMALASMITGIASIPLACCCLGGLTGIVAIVLGFIARNQIAQSQGRQDGAGMALAGIITGAVAVAILVVSIAWWLTGVFASYR